MSDMKSTVFARPRPQDKADQTTQMVRKLADQDRAAREKKTARLKALRLERDAAAPAPAQAEPPAKKSKRAK